ncbi:hypothetical protein ACP70R_007390 [Stipagrostis hirtigluma subsp. patula]
MRREADKSPLPLSLGSSPSRSLSIAGAPRRKVAGLQHQGDQERRAPMATQGAKRMLPLEDPATAAAQPVPLGDVFGGGALLGTRDSDDAEERGAILALPAPASDDGEEQEEAFLGGEDEELADDNDSDEEDEEVYSDGDDDSDSEFDDEDEPSESGAGKNVLVAPAVEFRGRRARFATIQSTAGFMRLVAAAEAGKQDSGGGEILVDYRYTRFCAATRGGGHGVDVCGGGTKVHRVRYLLSTPVAGDQATSLRLAGEVYPVRFSEPLQALWSAMVAAAPVRVPPRATRVEVTVDVGILRRGDRTPDRMRRMCAALPALAREAEAWPRHRSVGMELRLPAPVRCEEGDDGEARPAKKRKSVAGEECPICYEELRKGVVAWPGCSHAFHGGCLETLLLKGSQSCPMCRSTLSKPK